MHNSPPLTKPTIVWLPLPVILPPIVSNSFEFILDKIHSKIFKEYREPTRISEELGIKSMVINSAG
jgi:hypothetical protein